MPTLTLDGQSYFYTDHSPVSPAGLPLVLLHGAGGSHLHWPPALRRLPGANVYALDLPGHGRSAGPGRTTIAAYRLWLKSVVDALRLPPFVLAGHSMGGALALDFALAYPAQVAGLGLVGTSARLRVAPAILAGLASDFTATTAQLVELMYSPTAKPQTKRLALQRLRTVAPAVLLADFHACDAFDVSAQVSEITLPTLIICGQLDKMTPIKYSERLQAQMPQSELHLLADAGHMVMIEQAEQVTTLLATFLARVGAQR